MATRSKLSCTTLYFLLLTTCSSGDCGVMVVISAKGTIAMSQRKTTLTLIVVRILGIIQVTPLVEDRPQKMTPQRIDDPDEMHGREQR